MQAAVIPRPKPPGNIEREDASERRLLCHDVRRTMYEKMDETVDRVRRYL